MNHKEGNMCNIVFMGNRKDVHRCYQAMDIFVLPSRYEGLPVVGVEAQVNGLPCVLSDQVTKETKITENVEFVSIDSSPIEWAKRILEKGRRKLETGDISSEFDILRQAKRLEQFYETGLDKQME